MDDQFALQVTDEREKKLSEIKEQLKFTGRFLASIILSEDHVEMQLTNTFIQQVSISLCSRLCSLQKLYLTEHLF